MSTEVPLSLNSGLPMAGLDGEFWATQGSNVLLAVVAIVGFLVVVALVMFGADLVRGVIRDEMTPHYLTEGPGKQPIRDLCMDMALDLGVDVFVRQSQALRDRTDRQDLLRSLRMKTLVLCGREDRLCPVERHVLIQGLVTGSSLEVIDSAGHLPTLEQPAPTTAALLRWLEQ